MEQTADCPLADVSCCRDLPEHHEPVEESYAPELKPGFVLDGRFRLTKALSRSGMATIYKADDSLNPGEAVAVKVPHLKLECDAGFFSRFQREEEVGRRLDHPNIIKVLTPQKKSRMYIAMEYIEGLSLRAIMRDKQPIPAARALALTHQICKALMYMHSEGVVHRDLKPENMLVTDDGQIKIMDFGIALDESARRLTWSGLSSTIGTPDYMAPEQVSGRRGDARTDIYALGTILYEMLTTELPYAADNVYNMMRAKTNEDPQPPTRFVHDLDPHLEEIVLHAIERVPTQLHGLDGIGEGRRLSFATDVRDLRLVCGQRLRIGRAKVLGLDAVERWDTIGGRPIR